MNRTTLNIEAQSRRYTLLDSYDDEIGSIQYRVSQLIYPCGDKRDFDGINTGVGDFSDTGNVFISHDSETGNLDRDFPFLLASKLGSYIRNRVELIQSTCTKFDCLDFCHYLSHHHYDPHNRNVNNYDWHISENYKNLEIGDAILIGQMVERKDGAFKVGDYNFKKHIYHFANYVGDGNFISKLGGRGNILITSLDELQNIYPYQDIVRLQSADLQS